MTKIRKAIIPVAGMGTRWLPATKAQPKEMITLVDKPVIQYIVEEAVASGITEIIFVTSGSKRAIEDHFDRNFELEYRLQQKGKTKIFENIKGIGKMAKFAYVRQSSPKGDGHALLSARHLIGNEPVAVLFGDDVFDGTIPFTKQLIDVYHKYEDPVIGTIEVPKEEVSSYGVVGGTSVGGIETQVDSLVEKPKQEDAPSNLAIAGRYIITPEVFNHLEKIKPGKDGEIRLIDGLDSYLKDRSIYAATGEGTRYDCGNKLEFLKASVLLGLKHPELKDGFKDFIKNLKP